MALECKCIFSSLMLDGALHVMTTLLTPTHHAAMLQGPEGLHDLLFY